MYTNFFSLSIKSFLWILSTSANFFQKNLTKNFAGKTSVLHHKTNIFEQAERFDIYKSLFFCYIFFRFYNEQRRNSMFLENIKKTIQNYNMIEKGDKIVIGVSGGADSIALLAVLCALQKEYDINIEAVHIHHGLRGEEADRDALFVKQICKEWCVPCHVLEFDIAKEAREKGIGLEEMGRICRYNTFYDIAGKNGKIAVAHHQNDQAETVLFNLCRGTGLTGLCGMTPVRGNIIRPFLFVSRKEIECFLSEKNICYCQDSTNEQNHYTRNKIRLSVLPFLENEINDKAVKHIASAASILSEEETFLEELAEKTLHKMIVSKQQKKIALDINLLLSENVVMRRRIFRKAFCLIDDSLQDLSYIHIQQIEQLLHKQTGKRLSLPLKRSVLIEYNNILFSLENEVKSTKFCYKLLPEKAIYIKEIDKFVELSFNAYKKQEKRLTIYTRVFDYDKIKGDISCRTRQQGDSIAIGNGHQKKLKDFLIDAKIARQKRDMLLLFAVGKQILWIPGYRISSDFTANETTKNKLWISVWEGEKNERTY